MRRLILTGTHRLARKGKRKHERTRKEQSCWNSWLRTHAIRRPHRSIRPENYSRAQSTLAVVYKLLDLFRRHRGKVVHLLIAGFTMPLSRSPAHLIPRLRAGTRFQNLQLQLSSDHSVARIRRFSILHPYPGLHNTRFHLWNWRGTMDL